MCSTTVLILASVPIQWRFKLDTYRVLIPYINRMRRLSYCERAREMTVGYVKHIIFKNVL